MSEGKTRGVVFEPGSLAPDSALSTIGYISQPALSESVKKGLGRTKEGNGQEVALVDDGWSEDGAMTGAHRTWYH